MTPRLFNKDAVFGPMPYIFWISSGAKNLLSVPGRTTVNPSGLSKSEAILETNFDVDRPADAGSLVSSFILFNIVFTKAGGFACDDISTKASSTLILSNTPYRDRIFITLVEQDRIFGRFEETNFNLGHNLRALLEAIADLTPNSLASYEAEAITLLCPGFPPTANGFPLSSGFSSK